MSEQYLLGQKLKISVLPLPEQISAGCGICLRISQSDIDVVLKALADKQINILELFSKTKNDGRTCYDTVEDRTVSAKPKLGSLFDNCTSGGCGAKIGPGELSQLLYGLPAFYDENLIVGYDTSDDAGVYKIDEKNSIITTADFFPPMIDDPEIFGKIAAANALSDIYAMGGRPLTALNLVCFPQSMDMEVLKSILKGGADKVKEAEAVLAGGHSIYDKEPKYGLAVTGIVETNRIIRNNTPETGHKLILTKPLGTGIIMAAFRGEAASRLAVEKAIAVMQRLNKYAAEKMYDYDISACTDITGFGLLAHAVEMASDRVSMLIYENEIPYISEAYQYADEFLVTAAGQRNRNHLGGKVNVSKLPFALQELMFDPQTSGGLLISVSPGQSEELLTSIKADDPDSKIIGEIIKRESDVVIIR